MFKKMNKVLGLLIVVIVVLAGCSASPMEQNNVLVTEDPGKSIDGPTVTYEPIINTEEATEEPTKIFLPTVVNSYPQKNIMGAQLSEINDENALSLMLDAKSAWTRLDYRWGLVQPEKGITDWSRAGYIDQQLINAAEEGMEVLLILGDTPLWARYPDWPCGGKIDPVLYEDGTFSDFIFEFISRYSNPPFNVKYFEMWNEPDARGLLGCWGDNSEDEDNYGGEAYGEMLKIAYPAAKSANPNAEILIGGLLLNCDPSLGLTNSEGEPKCNSAYFLRGILEAGAGNSFDGVAFHAYDYYFGGLGKYGNANFNATWDTTGPVTLEKSKFIRNTLKDYGITDRYLMNTEAGLLCDRCDPLDETMQITKAYYVAQEFAVALADDYVANVWYSVYGDRDLNRNNELLTIDNEDRPAYNAFWFTTRALLNHEFVKKLNLDPNLMGFEFVASSGKKQWVVWSIDGKDHTVSLKSTPLSIHKIANSGHGELVSSSTNVIIGIAPVFIKY